MELLQHQRPERQQLIESRLRNAESAEEAAGVLRVVGRRLNAFFCPGRGCCGASSAKTAAGEAAAAAAAAATAGTSAESSSSAARITEESANDWQQAMPLEPRADAGVGRRAAATATAPYPAQQWARQSETARSLVAESTSANEILADEASSDSDSTRRPQRLPSWRGQQPERRRGSADTNMNSRQSSRRDSPKSPTATATPAKADGGGLDSLVQTLDRAARRRRRQQRRHPFADASAVSSRTATPSSRRSCQRRPQQLERRQPQRPCVEHCRFQICEVTCELGSPGLAGTDADDEDERC
ncbi:hypothetical protein BOX15_Mlig007847g2 [Macrostomum lignano]|uniref:Uncharacterized protein n=1 Tax=Macrostomum lignano TaxID=282301 RepID=A0A267DKH8_9PLAT|nr:hypothetical protein BOX15_Mlig007847g2 [Macrostomum lignano]